MVRVRDGERVTGAVGLTMSWQLARAIACPAEDPCGKPMYQEGFGRLCDDKDGKGAQPRTVKPVLQLAGTRDCQ